MSGGAPPTIPLSLHRHILTIDDLRSGASAAGVPSRELMDHVRVRTRAGMRSLELGCTLLTVQCAAITETHVCLAPIAAGEALSAVCQAQGTHIHTPRCLPGDVSGALAAEPSGSFEHIILSAPPAFPAYFAAANEAFRLLAIGGRLTVTGTGPWTIEQLKNFLRVDPRFGGFLSVGPDAVVVQKIAETDGVAWHDQPYVTLNSTIIDPASIADQRRRLLHGRIASFSTTADALAQAKRKAGVRLRVGLVGYYGFGNYGDELFRLAFEAGLSDIELVMLHDVPRRPYFLDDLARRVDQVDAIVIGGGDLLIPGYWTDFYFEREYLAKPVFLHGIGVPRWSGGDPAVMRRLKEFLRHPNVRHFNVRDVESAEWVNKTIIPSCTVSVSPDIVCGMDFGFAPRTVPPGSVLGLITRKQAVQDFTQIRMLVERSRSRGYSVKLIIAGNGLVGEEDRADAEASGLPVDEIIQTETIEQTTSAIVNCTIVASMKFHGCVVGTMAGVPTYGLLKTDKFINFYRALGIPHMLQDFRSEEAPKLLDAPSVPMPERLRAGMRDESRGAMQALRAALHGLA
jgi:polysaccharide pyruvyl transferase WcaK-like protein